MHTWQMRWRHRDFTVPDVFKFNWPKSGNNLMSWAEAHRSVTTFTIAMDTPIEPMIKRSYLSRRRLSMILPVSQT